MDKSWIDLSKYDPAYVPGVGKFIEFAFNDKTIDAVVSCPCKKCRNRYNKSKNDILVHCVMNGFYTNYKNWVYHGEALNLQRHNHENLDNPIPNDASDDMVQLVQEAMGFHGLGVDHRDDDLSTNECASEADEETNKVFKLLEDAKADVYAGNKKFSKLSLIVRILQSKALCGWTDKSVDIILEMLQDLLPGDAKVPKACYEAKKLINDFGFSYETWDAFPNNFMLFRGEDKDKNSCDICGASRYRDEVRKLAAKQMGYFPLKPQLQKLFMSSKTASNMRWHAEKRKDDGVLRHPADSRAWKDFDKKNPYFSSDVRNVRLGLSADGFNPFRTLATNYSIWPIVLMPYNLPLWLCMKQPYFILSTLIDGPLSPGQKIDVYLQSLIDELKELWEIGVPTFDAFSNQMFQMHATLLWTISDFSAYSMLSGWGVKVKLACPYGGKNTWHKRLEHCRKDCYMGHRRFLQSGHRFRRDTVSFDGKREIGRPPLLQSGSEVLQELDKYQVLTQYKKENMLKRRAGLGDEKSDEHNWKKRSIFFELPYWEHNLIRHNLDVMHVEKNVCDNILWTLLGDKKKSKDH